MVKRAQRYIKEYSTNKKELVYKRRLAKQNGGFYIEPEAKLAFIIRIRGLKEVKPKTKKSITTFKIKTNS